MRRLLLCLTGLLVLSGCAAPAARQEPTATPPPATASASAIEPSSSPTPTAAEPSVPTRLRIGDIDARVVPIELDGTSLTPPPDPDVLGWWGKRSGAAHGTTLLTGHTVHSGGGSFDHLEDTPVGARARLNGHDYEVESVEVISKEELAQRAPALFAQTGRPKLVLVTCEDYDLATGQYASNVVVVLTPLGAP